MIFLVGFNAGAAHKHSPSMEEHRSHDFTGKIFPNLTNQATFWKKFIWISWAQ